VILSPTTLLLSGDYFLEQDEIEGSYKSFDSTVSFDGSVKAFKNFDNGTKLNKLMSSVSMSSDKAFPLSTTLLLEFSYRNFNLL
jgi:hypothetical protein